MLNKLGTFITKNRWWVIATWVVLAVVITAFAPKISEVTSTDQTSFLPSKYESVQAQKVGEKAFPQSKDDTEILLVKRVDGAKLTTEDQQTITKLTVDLKAAKIDRVQDATTSTEAQNVSKDGTAQMVQISVKGQATGDAKDVAFVKALRAEVKKQVQGTDLTTGLTGNIANNADSNSTFDNTTKIVTMATFALIITASAPITSCSCCSVTARSCVAARRAAK
jgi:RND superfamily putative drug exporter